MTDVQALTTTDSKAAIAPQAESTQLNNFGTDNSTSFTIINGGGLGRPAWWGGRCHNHWGGLTQDPTHSEPALDLNKLVQGIMDRMGAIFDKMSGIVSDLVDRLSKAKDDSQTEDTSSTPSDTTSEDPADPAVDPAPTGEDSGTDTSGTKVKATPLQGSGFLWKPEGNDKNLVVLLPKKLTGKVSSVSVVDKNGHLRGKGKMSGVANGGREHYRFTKPGAKFPPGCKVIIHLKDGTKKFVTISHPEKRLQK